MSAPETHGRRSDHRSILLIDADASLRTIASLHLTPGGLEVVEAADHDAAIDLAGERRIAAVVARAGGPRLDAATFLERLRASREAPVRDLPVLLVSGTPSPALAELCARLPPARVLAAPVTGPRLVAALETLLAG